MEIFRILFKIMSYFMIYLFLKHLLVEENIMNFLFLCIFLIFLFIYQRDLKVYFILILAYHSFYLLFSFFYNMIDHELTNVSNETVLGFNFNQCFNNIYSDELGYHSPSLCDTLKNMMVLNFVFRISYYILVRLEFLEDSRPD